MSGDENCKSLQSTIQNISIEFLFSPFWEIFSSQFVFLTQPSTSPQTFKFELRIDSTLSSELYHARFNPSSSSFLHSLLPSMSPIVMQPSDCSSSNFSRAKFLPLLNVGKRSAANFSNLRIKDKVSGVGFWKIQAPLQSISVELAKRDPALKFLVIRCLSSRGPTTWNWQVCRPPSCGI